MLITVQTDYTALATALMPEAKRYLRIDTDEDDTGLQEVLVRVIAQFEHTMEQGIGGTGFVWTVDQFDLLPGGIVYPPDVTPFPTTSEVTAWAVVRAGTVITGQFTFIAGPPCALQGDLQIGDVVEYASLPTVTDSVRDALLQLTVDWWERRGTQSDFTVTDMPGFVDRWLMTHWNPRC